MTKDLLADYNPNGSFCEMLGGADISAEHTIPIRERLNRISLDNLRLRAKQAEQELFNQGITFTVYSERDAIDRILPFDVIPRIISRKDWEILEKGCIQRITALNMFLHDVYHEQKILKDGIVPADLVLGNQHYRKEMKGIDLPFGVYSNICGIDIIRGPDGVFRVLEDNARTPSGVSYVIENRHLMLRSFTDLVSDIGVRPVSEYGVNLFEKLCEIAPNGKDNPQVALLSPGIFNAAYFEHVFLAREMGVPLVEGRDLIVDENDYVCMKTTKGLVRIDVLYRRIDDAFLDPEVFRKDSMLGVKGLMRSYLSGKVTLANAVGTGVCDDKATYAYMPRIIKYYLSEEAIIKNVQTNICREKEALAYTLANMENLVVKPVGESGGYGITIGPLATKAEIAEAREKLIADPSNYISQPMIDLSVCPTLTEDGIGARHVDLRPFIVTGKKSWVLPGGLTRVALRKGSMIVNSSQGGGTKDTWVLE